LAPHYLAECIEYLALGIAGAPPGQWINKTLACALIFVMVNLGVTAHGSKKWYVQRFGEKSIQGKARMIPFIW
jgi:3-oxo-5-alpha-steroid 4-dehydrogenase 3